MACLLSVSHLKSTLYSFIPFLVKVNSIIFHTVHTRKTQICFRTGFKPTAHGLNFPLPYWKQNYVRNHNNSQQRCKRKREIRLSGGSNIFQVAGLSLVAQILKSLPTRQETRVQSMGGEESPR